MNCKNIPIKIYKKIRNNVKYELSFTHGQLSHTSTGNYSYNQISPYIEKPYFLSICLLDEDLKNVRNENPISCGS